MKTAAAEIVKNNPQSFFEEVRPLEFEVGCGKGRFLLSMAEKYPERNFIGIDRAGKWMNVGKTRAEKRQLPNLRFIKTEAREFLESIPEEIFETIHMYFPDPWPKRRHHPRRTLNESFLKLLYSRLKPGGFIEIATDDADYYVQIRAAAEATRALWKEMRETRNARIVCPEFKTNYELKFEAEGRTLYYLEMRK